MIFFVFVFSPQYSHQHSKAVKEHTVEIKHEPKIVRIYENTRKYLTLDVYGACVCVRMCVCIYIHFICICNLYANACKHLDLMPLIWGYIKYTHLSCIFNSFYWILWHHSEYLICWNCIPFCPFCSSHLRCPARGKLWGSFLRVCCQSNPTKGNKPLPQFDGSLFPHLQWTKQPGLSNWEIACQQRIT